MKHLFLLGALWLPLLGLAQVSADARGVEQTIATFFQAMQARDTATLSSLMAPELVFRSVAVASEVNPQVLREVEPTAFLQSIGQAGEVRLREEVSNLRVHLDGPLAIAWMDYHFYLDGKLHHCGANSFTLLYRSDRWQVIHLIDTRRNDCE